MTSAPTTTQTTEQVAVSIPRPALVARLLALFSGPLGVVLKYVFLALANALGIWAFVGLVSNEKWFIAAAAAIATIAIDLFYLLPGRRFIPAKFLVPGVIMLIVFQVVPIVYNAGIAFTNWSTGHNLTKEEAIFAIQEASLVPPADGRTFVMTPAKQNGKLVLLLVGDVNGKPFAGTEDGLEPLAPADVTIENGAITAADGLSDRHGRGPGRDRPAADRLEGAGRRGHLHRRRGIELGGRAHADPALRRAGRHLHERRDGRRVQRQRRGVLRRPFR